MTSPTTAITTIISDFCTTCSHAGSHEIGIAGLNRCACDLVYARLTSHLLYFLKIVPVSAFGEIDMKSDQPAVYQRSNEEPDYAIASSPIEVALHDAILADELERKATMTYDSRSNITKTTSFPIQPVYDLATDRGAEYEAIQYGLKLAAGKGYKNISENGDSDDEEIAPSDARSHSSVAVINNVPSFGFGASLEDEEEFA